MPDPFSAEPQTPMTGSGVQRRTLAPDPNQPVDPYVVPAHNTILRAEAQDSPSLKILRRRLMPLTGERRL